MFSLSFSAITQEALYNLQNLVYVILLATF